MKYSITFFTALLLIIITNNLFSFQYYNGIRISKNGKGYIIEYTLPEYNLINVSVKDEQFARINLEQYGITYQPGLPMLPQISFFMMINTAETMPGIQVISSTQTAASVPYKIYPTQAPWEKSRSLDERPFTINRIL